MNHKQQEAVEAASIIWVCDAYKRTISQAAQLFAQSYFRESRNARPLDQDGFFGISDGYQTYHIRLSPKDEDGHDRPTYFVVRFSG